ncbi:MAG: Na+:solute symporter [Phycisphaerae bacterium]|nr:Na+:solute symporter [Phycisphaerae bacterium]
MDMLAAGMQLRPIDWFFIIAYCLVAFGIGIYFSKRASQNMDEFFVAGRNLPWWLAGTSIVATTFAADTPLAVSGFVRSKGIYANWFWWSALMGGLLCVFFYARMWRRAGIITDMEFIELRYEGKAASSLRAFMSVYGGVLQNCIIMGWVMLAMAKILDVMLGWPKVTSITVLVVMALFYTVLSGFWGVVMTDLVQFIMAMAGSIALAVIVMVKMGGPAEMVRQVADAPGVDLKVFHMVPDFKTATHLAITTFVIQVTFQWWGGGQGGGYLAQRLFATRSERDSVLAALWFNFAHYVLRPWPWIIVGLASLVYFPQTQGVDPELGYPQMMARFLPTGLRGLMVASLLAAFMSTIDTQLNWGASYLINDLYKRFFVRSASARHYVNASRVAMLILIVLGALTAWKMDSISGAWIYLTVLTAGAGFVGLLRWYWWRVNPWSEISALLSSLILANANHLIAVLHRLGFVSTVAMDKVRWFHSEDLYSIRMAIIIIICTAIWVVVTYLTHPTSDAHLEAFYRRVRPAGWWRPVADRCPEVPRESAAWGWAGWLSGIVCIYTGLFGIGYLCLGHTLSGIGCLVVSLATGWFMGSRASAEPPRA